MKFVLITKQPLTDDVINVTSQAFFDQETDSVLETVNINVLKDFIKEPPKAINITLKPVSKKAKLYFTEVLIRTITPAYLRGTVITVNGHTFEQCTRNPQYLYTWQDRIPSSLPSHLKQAYYDYKLRGKLYDELVAWNQSRISLAQNRSKFKWVLAEKFYKDLHKALAVKGIKVQSPNQKTIFEYMAEKYLEDVTKPQAPLTLEESSYLNMANANNYIRAFGLQDCDVMVNTRHRKTAHGITEEPYLTNLHELEQTSTARFFNRKHAEDTPKTVWNSSTAFTITCPSKQRENIESLKWFLSQPQDIQELFLMPGWHFCPECGKLYHENDGCYENDYCHVREITFVPYNENHDEEEC